VPPDELLPQQPIDERVEVDSVEWLFEPEWPGMRLLARTGPHGVHLSDATGSPVDDPGFAVALAGVLGGETATIDGVWTERGSVDDEGGPRPGFVAIDMLELAGESLLDVPFQERRRLLGSILADGPTIRVGPLVKQPLSGWLPGWREAGFTHLLARHQNARYHPGASRDDWLRIPIDAPSAPGLAERFIGSRRRRARRIAD
jgi:bifunctional non-homologous end joining protein LigD